MPKTVLLRADVLSAVAGPAAETYDVDLVLSDPTNRSTGADLEPGQRLTLTTAARDYYYEVTEVLPNVALPLTPAETAPPAAVTQAGGLSLPFNGGFNGVINGVISTPPTGTATTTTGVDGDAVTYFPPQRLTYFGLPTVNGDYTIAAWVRKPNSSNTARASFFDHNDGVTIFYASAVGAQLRVYAPGFLAPFTALFTADWTHVAVTRAGNVTRLFVNGLITQTSTALATPLFVTAEPLLVGSGVLDNVAGFVDQLWVVPYTVWTADFAPTAPASRPRARVRYVGPNTLPAEEPPLLRGVLTAVTENLLAADVAFAALRVEEPLSVAVRNANNAALRTRDKFQLNTRLRFGLPVVTPLLVAVNPDADMTLTGIFARTDFGASVGLDSPTLRADGGFVANVPVSLAGGIVSDVEAVLPAGTKSTLEYNVALQGIMGQANGVALSLRYSP
jgi:Concanavalin A-like lectin/glucanases superfamily